MRAKGLLGEQIVLTLKDFIDRQTQQWNRFPENKFYYQSFPIFIKTLITVDKAGENVRHLICREIKESNKLEVMMENLFGKRHGLMPSITLSQTIGINRLNSGQCLNFLLNCASLAFRNDLEDLMEL